MTSATLSGGHHIGITVVHAVISSLAVCLKELCNRWTGHLHSAGHVSQALDEQLFMFSEVAAVFALYYQYSANCGHPLPVVLNNRTRSAACRHTIAFISRTRPWPSSHICYSFSVPLQIGGWVDLSIQQVGELRQGCYCTDRVCCIRVGGTGTD